MSNKVIWGFVIGIAFVATLWLFVMSKRNELGFGMAILPLIGISIVLFAVGFAIGFYWFGGGKK